MDRLVVHLMINVNPSILEIMQYKEIALETSLKMNLSQGSFDLPFIFLYKCKFRNNAGLF